MTTPITLLNDQFVDMAFITRLTGLTNKWFYKLIQEGHFPKPIKLGRSSRWLQTEVEAWLQARIEQSRGPSLRGGTHTGEYVTDNSVSVLNKNATQAS